MLQAAIGALANIGAGNVQVIGPDSSVNGGVFFVIFRNELANANLPAITVAQGALATTEAPYPAVGGTTVAAATYFPRAPAMKSRR